MDKTLEALLIAAQETAAGQAGLPTPFPALRAQMRGELLAANAMGYLDGPDLRPVALQLFVVEALGWFARWPTLESITVKCEVIGRVRMRADYTSLITAHHRLTVTLHGIRPEHRPSGDAMPYLEGLLPRQLLGPGDYCMQREWSQVQDYLQLPDSELAHAEALVWTLAKHMAAQFVNLTFAHEHEALVPGLG